MSSRRLKEDSMSRLIPGLLLVMVSAACAPNTVRPSTVPRQTPIPDCDSNEIILRASNHGSVPADVVSGKDLLGTVNPGSTLLVNVAASTYRNGAIRAIPRDREPASRSQPVGQPRAFRGVVFSAQCP
jgi:hypothetical protein